MRHSRLFYGNIITGAGFLIWMVGWGTFTPAFSVFLKPLTLEFGWSRAEASIAYSLSFMVFATLGIMIGWLTDRFGPRMVVIFFGSFLGICYLLMSQINALWQFQLNLIIIGGIGASSLNIPVMVTISKWFIKRRGFMIGIVQAGNGVGGFIFPLISGWLILNYGWRSAYGILGIITLLGITIGGSLLRRDPIEMGEYPDGERLFLHEEENKDKSVSKEINIPFRKALYTIQFWMIAGLYFSFGFCRTTFLAHIAAHVQDLGFSLRDGANVLACITGTSMFGRVGMGKIADKIGNRKAFIISFGLTGFSLFLGLIAKELWLLYLFSLLFGFGWGNQAVLRVSLTSEVFGLSSLGIIMGVLVFFESGAATFGSFFAGYIFDTFHSYNPIFLLGIGISIMGIILAWALRPISYLK